MYVVRGTYMYVDDVDMTVYIGMIYVRYKIVPYFGMRFAIFSILLQQSDIICEGVSSTRHRQESGPA